MKRATYYYCVKERPDKYASLRAEITRVFEENKGRYGYRRVCLQLRGNGLTINHKTVARLMAEMNLHAYRRKLRYHSYKGEVGRIDGLFEYNGAKIPVEIKSYTETIAYNMKGARLMSLS